MYNNGKKYEKWKKKKDKEDEKLRQCGFSEVVQNMQIVVRGIKIADLDEEK